MYGHPDATDEHRDAFAVPPPSDPFAVALGALSFASVALVLAIVLYL